MGKIRKAVCTAGAALLSACMLGSCGLADLLPAPADRDAVSRPETAGTLTEILSGLWEQQEETPEQEEMRAVWVSYLDLSPLLKGKSEAEFAASAKELCQNCAAVGLNTLIVQVRPFCDSFYPSRYFPWSKWASGTLGEALRYDPVRILRDEAGRQGLAFHGWLNPMRGCTEEEMPLVPEEYPVRRWYDDPDAREENLMIVDGIVYLNPASPDVRKLIADGAAEIQENYRTDGIHIDDYFYPPGMEEGADSASYQAYLSQGGTLDLAAWRRENTFAMVKELSAAVHETDPAARFGVSPRGSLEQNYSDLYIDVEQWIQSGILDYIAPQIYYGFENDAAPFDETARQWDRLARAGGVPLIAGLAAYKVGKTDAYAGGGASEWIESEDLLARQILFARDLPSYGGLILFRYGSLFDPPEETAEAAMRAQAIWAPLLLEEPSQP